MKDTMWQIVVNKWIDCIHTEQSSSSDMKTDNNSLLYPSTPVPHWFGELCFQFFLTEEVCFTGFVYPA